MSRTPVEQVVQSYLVANKGKPLKNLNKKLELIETEHKIEGGRIDILCEERNWPRNKLTAIELKALNYNTSHAIGQLTKYLNYADQVYFLAPKVKKEIYIQLKKPYRQNKLWLYEYKIKPRKGFYFKQMKPKDLKDEREIKWMDEQLKQELNTQRIKHALNIKNTESIRAAMDILYFLKDNRKMKKATKQDMAKIGIKILEHYDDYKGVNLISKALEIYAKI